jgi:WD40 repeat protein
LPQKAARHRMSAIFISHSSSDNAVAGELKERLGEQGHRSVFLDFDPEDGIPAGRDWERELYARLRGCQAVIVLCSEQSMASRWCFAEIAFARSLGKALLPIRIDGCAIPSAFTDVQTIDFRADREQGYQRLWAGLRQAGLDPAGMFDWDGSRPPYPGLMVFQEQDAAVYFGRGAEIQATIEKLNRMQRLGDASLAMVLGASGSGKSSLLRAGVMPRLKRDRDRWLAPGPVRPLGQPFEQLAMVLADVFKGSGAERPWQEIRDRLAQPAADAAAAYMIDLANDLRAARGQAEATLLLAVDQFEELLTPSEDDADDRFLALLRALVEARSGSIVVIGTLRSDFLGSFQNHTALRGLTYEPIDLPQLSVDAFAEVIEGPARLAGLELEAGLTGAIVADAATDDALPLLAFALRELWEARGADGRLTIDRYRNGLGGLQGSVAKAADGLYPQAFASCEEERDVRNAFLAMVRVDAGGAYVRKPARWNELPASAHGLLERFVQGRLLVSRGEGTDRILEVAHEALIRRWDKLRGWVEEDREFLRTRERIEGTAARWIEAGRDASLLLPRGRPLAEAQEILVQRRLDLASNIIELIESSIAAKRTQDDAERAAQQRLLDAERERVVAARRLARRTRNFAVGIGVGAVLAVGSAVYAVWQANETEKQREIAVSRQLAAQGLNHSSSQMDLALLLSLEANRILDTVETRGTLLEVLESNPYPTTYLRGHAEQVQSVAISPEGQTLASGSFDGTIVLWDVATHQQLGRPLVGHTGKVYSVTFSSDGQTLASGGEEGSIIFWDVASREVRERFESGAGEVRSVALSLDGKTLAVGSFDGSIRLWDIGTQKPLGPPLQGHTQLVGSVAFSPDSQRLASGSDDGGIILWDVASLARTGQPLVGHEGWVTNVTFSPDGQTLISSSGDKSIILWDANTHEIRHRLIGHTGWVLSAAISPDGKTIASGGQDSSIVLWDTATHQPVTQPLGGHNGAIRSIAFTPDGKTLVSGGDDSTIILWDVLGRHRLGEPFGNRRNVMARVALSPDGKTLAASGDDNAITLWDTRAHKPLAPPLRGHDSTVRTLAFSPDGATLASGGEDASVILWDVADGRLLDRLSGHRGKIFSIAFSRDGRTLVSGSGDGTAILWDVAGRRRLEQLRGHSDRVLTVAFSSDGKWLATGSWDMTVRLWDVTDTSKVERIEPQPPVGLVHAVTFSPDGQTLAVGGFSEEIIPTDRTNQTRAQSRAVMEARRAGASRRAFHAWQQASAMAS